MCPALLQRQWQSELKRKFSVDFKLIDSGTTFQIRRELGIDTNPWKAYPRIITPMDYLRLPDITHQFMQASEVNQDSQNNGPYAPWDLLIVDECHNFAPQSGKRFSQRTKMLQDIRFLFEHRIFLSATPHNGKTVSFTGLLELLDPIRFQMKAEMDEKDKKVLSDVRIRRLKDDINMFSIRPPFAEQLDPKEIPVQFTSQEKVLFNALRDYREKGQQYLTDHGNATEKWVGSFIFSLLTKRLLSCPFAFARTWWRHLQTDDDLDENTQFSLALRSSEKAEEDRKDDEDKIIIEKNVVRHGGAWFKHKKIWNDELIQNVNHALEKLGLNEDFVLDDTNIGAVSHQSDSKTEALVQWVKENLFDESGKLRNDERLIVFTEYKETLEYLKLRFY